MLNLACGQLRPHKIGGRRTRHGKHATLYPRLSQLLVYLGHGILIVASVRGMVAERAHQMACSRGDFPAERLEPSGLEESVSLEELENTSATTVPTGEEDIPR